MKVKRLYLKYVYVTVWLHSLLIIYKQHKDKSTLLECTLAIKGPLESTVLLKGSNYTSSCINVLFFAGFFYFYRANSTQCLPLLLAPMVNA